MNRKSSAAVAMETDDQFQRRMLAGVSRTFALTIPELPSDLFSVVANAYLLCRIADTIEDDMALDAEATREFSERFIGLVNGDDHSVESFSSDLAGVLSQDTTDLEKELVGETPRVLSITRGFSVEQRDALADCVAIMSRGMAEFSRAASRRGLKDQAEMDRYCYVVAGVVGECLTRLFAVYSPEISAHRERLMTLSVSFGQGLQMTNILKDVWGDYERGVCWLPRELFEQYGFSLDALAESERGPGYRGGMEQLIALTHHHLQNALDYVKLLPSHERGLRNFCLWAIGMAVLTLKRINDHLDYRSGDEVKISRKEVYATVWGSRLLVGSNHLLQLTFDRLCAGLPDLSSGRGNR